jgi:ribosomal protein S12 methylthiotransferase accessory factor
VIERDAATLFGLESDHQRENRRVDPSTVGTLDCQELLAQFDRAGVEVALFDMTCDSGVSVFRAVIADAVLDPGRPRPPSTGTGCHPSRDIALSRALTEAAQSRLTMIAGSRDDLPRDRYSADGDLDRLRGRRNRAFRGEARRSFDATPTFKAAEIGEDVVWQKERLVAIGIAHIIVVDLTKTDVGIPVVRVLIPELEPPSDVPGWMPGKRAKAVQAKRTA